jgi:hypothetical protein
MIFFGKKKLLLAFEYALILSQTAKELGIILTPEIAKKMEEIIKKEFPWKTPERLSIDMVVNIMSALEPK